MKKILFNIYRKIVGFVISIFVHPRAKNICIESGLYIYDNSYEIYKYLNEFYNNKLFYIVYNEEERVSAIKKGLSPSHVVSLFKMKSVVRNAINYIKIYSIYRKSSLFFVSFNDIFSFIDIKLNKKQNLIYLGHSQFPWKSSLAYYQGLVDSYKSKNKMFFRLGTEESFKHLASGFQKLDVNFFYAPMPRNQNLYIKCYDKFLKLLSNKINKDSKIILFMTTFKTMKFSSFFEDNFPLSLSLEDFEFIESYLEKNNMYLLIKLHHANNFSEKDEFIEKYSHFIILETNDFFKNDLFVNDIFQYTDALVTDYSSCLFDYLYIDKPIGYALGDRKEYEQNNGFSIPFDQFIVGDVFCNKDEMIKFFDSIINNEDKYKEQRKKLHIEYNGSWEIDNYAKFIVEKFVPNKFKKVIM